MKNEWGTMDIFPFIRDLRYFKEKTLDKGFGKLINFLTHMSGRINLEYEKPELIEHEELTQVTFSMH